MGYLYLAGIRVFSEGVTDKLGTSNLITCTFVNSYLHSVTEARFQAIYFPGDHCFRKMVSVSHSFLSLLSLLSSLSPQRWAVIKCMFMNQGLPVTADLAVKCLMLLYFITSIRVNHFLSYMWLMRPYYVKLVQEIIHYLARMVMIGVVQGKILKYLLNYE